MDLSLVVLGDPKRLKWVRALFDRISLIAFDVRSFLGERNSSII